MRDPSIRYGPTDGKFHLTYTTGWYVTNFGYMESSDLLNWTGQKQVNIMRIGSHHARSPGAGKLLGRRQQSVYRLLVFGGYIPGERTENLPQHYHRF